MPRPFQLLDRVETPEGPLELRQRGERDFMITVGGRVLMTSQLQRSELAVAELSCARIAARKAPRVLIGGLGLGYTLRAALDALPRNAHVQLAELNEAVVRWCRGPLAPLTDAALSDPRVEVVVDDVMACVARAAQQRQPFDAIVIDLYVGPDDRAHGARDPLYGREALSSVRRALVRGGVYAVWSEEPSAAFEARLEKLGFRVELVRAGGGGPRHAVYLATT